MYALGVDLGTTFTAAATWRDGHAVIASLGSRGAAIPSVVLLREDETFVTGEAADRRGISEPHRVAREFKRRLGDTTPLLLGGVPYSAEALMARLLRSVVDEVSAREGGPPSTLCVSYPANWGPYKTDLLRQAVRLANLELPVSYATEPEAAAAFYARQQRIEPGAVVAVYDLGGGTFDAAVLRKTPSGFEILGRPEGIERLGGIDFDAAVFNHVGAALGGKLAELDEDDPAAVAAVARLREECVRAKEALSADTDTAIPVLLPNLSTEVRLTRAELEAMVRPALHDSIEALKRALRSARVAPEQLHSVLLVGGSSRMPIVAQLVGAELGRPVAVDAHPKHAVALGAAWLASGQSAAPVPAAAGPAAVPPATGPAAPPPARATPPPAVPPVAAPPPAVTLPPVAPAVAPMASAPVASAPAGPPAARGRAVASVPPVPRRPEPRATEYGTPLRPPTPAARRRVPVVLAIAGALVILLASAGIAFALNSRRASNTPGAQGGPSQTASPVGSAAASGPALPADEQCTQQIKSNPRWVCLTRATFDGQRLVIEYTANNGGTAFNVGRSFHLHIYGTDASGTNPPDTVEGAQAPRPGRWYVEDKNPSIRSVTSNEYREAIGSDAVKVCARIADSRHRLVPDTSGSGSFKTGNCVPIVRV
jgi:molecular chaperone DnaK